MRDEYQLTLSREQMEMHYDGLRLLVLSLKINLEHFTDNNHEQLLIKTEEELERLNVLLYG